MPKRKDLLNTKIGSLSIVGWDDSKKKWRVVCDCGHVSIRNSYSLTKSNTTCYACHKRDLHTYVGTHYKTKTSTYNSWRGMKDRVQNERHYGHKWYKEKGITICERWLTFANFLEDMGEKPPQMTLDRIDNEKGYYKENCRWATMTTQRRNRSDTIRLEFNGEMLTLAEIAEKTGIRYKTLTDRVSQQKWDIYRATSEPVGGYERDNPNWKKKVPSWTRKFLYSGKELTLCEISLLCGIKETTLRERINSGWSLERATSETPKVIHAKH